jgi:hypothetical protein
VSSPQSSSLAPCSGSRPRSRRTGPRVAGGPCVCTAGWSSWRTRPRPTGSHLDGRRPRDTPGALSQAIGADVGVGDYLDLASFVSSLATVGGALGAGLETDVAVCEGAYA